MLREIALGCSTLKQPGWMLLEGRVTQTAELLDALLAQEPVAVRYQLPVGQGFFYSDFPPHVSLEIAAPRQLLYAMPVARQDDSV